MSDGADHVWILAILVSVAGITAILSYMGSCVKHVTMVHDLRVRVAELRRERLNRTVAMPASSNHASNNRY